ncbi:hypothetical protein OB919_13915 [Halobacteria archaeon AArc-curdl1]|uniref:Uncharacterized protein n=1 Tax=Natronosalvus hydrolyticus TaxID=2979988 RepID=A0AAP3E7K9_9EURY|nr:hypothetical protein [Halobacteria archaeon AArc-curdl1]
MTRSRSTRVTAVSRKAGPRVGSRERQPTTIGAGDHDSIQVIR